MYGSEPTAEGHAEQMRGYLSEAMGADSIEEASPGALPSAETASSDGGTPFSTDARNFGRGRPMVIARRGPTVHRYNLGTWGTYHFARLAARGLAGTARETSDQK
jgi:hypothetical protein